MIMSIILPAVVAFFVVFMLGTIEPKGGRPVKTRKKVEVYLIFLFLALCGIAYVYLKLFSDGLL